MSINQNKSPFHHRYHDYIFSNQILAYILFTSRYLVEQGSIPPLCDLLTLTDAKTVQVALNGLDNILKAGQQSDQRDNPYAVLIEECFGKLVLVNIL